MNGLDSSVVSEILDIVIQHSNREGWRNFDYGPFGNKACNLCEQHLKCPMEEKVFIERILGKPYCSNFKLSSKVREELIRRGLTEYLRDDEDEGLTELQRRFKDHIGYGDLYFCSKCGREMFDAMNDPNSKCRSFVYRPRKQTTLDDFLRDDGS